MKSWLPLIVAVVATFTYYSRQDVGTDSVGSAQPWGTTPAGAWSLDDDVRQLLAEDGTESSCEGETAGLPCADNDIGPPYERLLVLGDLHGDLGQARAALSLIGATNEVCTVILALWGTHGRIGRPQLPTAPSALHHLGTAKVLRAYPDPTPIPACHPCKPSPPPLSSPPRPLTRSPVCRAAAGLPGVLFLSRWATSLTEAITASGCCNCSTI